MQPCKAQSAAVCERPCSVVSCACSVWQGSFGASLSSGCTSLATDFSWSPTTGDRHRRQEQSCCGGGNCCSGAAESAGHLVECTTSRSLELIWARGQRFLKVSRREFVVGVEVDKFVRALSELYQEQVEHVPGLRVVVEGSW